MADEFKHRSAGAELTQAEDDATNRHLFAGQAAGDIMFAEDATYLKRLGVGANDTVLHVAAGLPAWSATLGGLTLTAPTINACTLGGTVTGGTQLLNSLGRVGIGEDALANVMLDIAGSIDSADNAFAIYTGNLTLSPEDTWSAFFYYGGGNVEAPGGEVIANAYNFYAAAMTKIGAGVITNAISCWLPLPTIATNNYIFEFPADANDPTGGGAAAVGRVKCLIGGATRWLAYY